MKYKILQDEKNGKNPRPWRSKKVRSLILADSLYRLDQNKRATRIWWCSSTLGFKADLETNRKSLYLANFCRERLCPMCQWRKSLKVFYQVSKVMDKVREQHDNLVQIFLTLTVKNCFEKELLNNLDMIFQGWYQLTKHRKIKRITHGWFRALEVTYNARNNTYHPHFHVLMAVNSSFFTNRTYIKQKEWLELWRSVMKDNSITQVDVRKVAYGRNNDKYVIDGEVKSPAN